MQYLKIAYMIIHKPINNPTDIMRNGTSKTKTVTITSPIVVIKNMHRIIQLARKLLLISIILSLFIAVPPKILFTKSTKCFYMVFLPIFNPVSKRVMPTPITKPAAAPARVH